MFLFTSLTNIPGKVKDGEHCRRPYTSNTDYERDVDFIDKLIECSNNNKITEIELISLIASILRRGISDNKNYYKGLKFSAMRKRKRKIIPVVDKAIPYIDNLYLLPATSIRTILDRKLQTIYTKDLSCFNDFIEEHIDKAEFVGIDIETTGLNPFSDNICTIQLCFSDSYEVMVFHSMYSDTDGVVIESLQKLLLSDVVKILHNAKFDLSFFKVKGYQYNNVLHDTMIFSKLALAGVKGVKHGLDAVMDRYFGYKLSKDERLSDWARPNISKKQINYAAKDVLALCFLYAYNKRCMNDGFVDTLSSSIRPYPELDKIMEVEMRVLPAIVDMQVYGIKLDLDKINEMNEGYLKEIDQLEQELNKFAKGKEVLWTSPSQVLNFLQHYDLKKPDPDWQLSSASFKDLQPLAEDNPIIATLLKYREVTKMVTTYTSALPKRIDELTGRIHPSIWQMGTHTGRMSSSGPNLQNFPHSEEFRSLFVPEKGNKYIIADYSQIELRIVASVANDEVMLAAYNKGEDIHKQTASLILGKPLDDVTKADRSIAKSANFGIVYGSSVPGFKVYAETQFNLKLSIQEAFEIHQSFLKGYSGIHDWHMKTAKELKTFNLEQSNYGLDIGMFSVLSLNLYSTTTMLGRRRFFDPSQGSLTVTTLLNTPIQGTGADIVKVALGDLWEKMRFDPEAWIIGVVHDEIILEVAEEKVEYYKQLLTETMENAGKMVLQGKVPVIAEANIAENWGEKG